MEEKLTVIEDKFVTIHPCPVLTTLEVIGGKWKPAILWELQLHQIRRFGKLKRALPGITQKMLTQQLRELEKDNVIHRKVYAEVPPRVEYRLTDYGVTLIPILHEMAQWGWTHRKENASDQ
ncbi:MAG: helix-turn-helix domain-containing protein [Tunicatimonas sp.]|uniref:winged helix-turn-helix transcriptional regulator n=1 Tax=Tunicatimonas sp. TaxID=1940096 RepID=UPI003C744502